MTNRFGRWFRDPVVLLGVVAGLIAFVVQSGDVDSVDTVRRLQTTHSFWTSAPPVLPNDYPEFGLHGRGGRVYAWYGIGQSLLMLPADIVGTYLERLPVFADYNGNDPSVRNVVVGYSTNILLNVLTALVCLRFLLLLGFEMKQAVAGVLALLLCTTHLHYTQNMTENNYIMLLTLGGFTYQYEWLLTGNRRALRIGSSAFGLNLLTRLTVPWTCSPDPCFCYWCCGLQTFAAALCGSGVWPTFEMRSRVRSLPLDGPPVPVLSLWIVFPHLCRGVRRGTAPPQAMASSELPV